MMQALIAALLVVTAFAAAPKKFPETFHAGFLRALSLIARDQKAQAYPILEEIYAGSRTTEERVKAALLLSYAGNRDLKLHKRHEYAEYYASHASKEELPQKELDSFYRIAGDGYFDQGDLNRAEDYYSRMAKSSELSNVDYAHYKLGWIELNRGAPALSFARWLKRLNASAPSAQSLRESMVRDLGRAWAETTPPTEEQLSAVRGLSLTKEEAVRFTDGFLNGLRRLKKSQEIAAIRAQLYQTDFASLAFTKVLAQRIGFSDDPCGILDWLDGPVKIEGVDPNDGLPALNHCYRQLKEKHPEELKNTKIKDRLISASKKFQAVGLARWPRAEFFREIEDEAAACHEFLAMSHEHFDAQKKLLPAETDERSVMACHEYVTKRPVEAGADRDFAKEFTSLLMKYSGEKLVPNDQKNAYYALVVVAQDGEKFRSRLLDAVLSNPETFKKTLFPSIAAASLKKPEDLSDGAKLFYLYAPRPLSFEGKMDKVWIEILRAQVKSKVDKKNFVEAQKLLEEYLPLDKNMMAQKSAPELWMLWALAVPDSTQNAGKVSGIAKVSDSGKQVSRLFIDSLGSGVEGERRDLALATALKFDELDAIWAKWARHEMDVGGDASLLSQFYQRSFEKAMEGKLELSFLEKVPQGHSIAHAVRALEKGEMDDSLADSLGRLELGLSDSPAPAFLKDYKRILALREQEASRKQSKLAFNLKLPQKIEGRFSKLNKQFESLKSATWSNPKLARMAGLTVAKSCERFISDLDGIDRPRGLGEQNVKVLFEQIHSVRDLVRQWRETLIKNAAQGESS